MMITAVGNQRIRHVQSLNRKASLRREEGLFTVEGVRMFMETPSDRIEELFVSSRFLEKSGREVRERLELFSFTEVADEVFPALSDTKTPQGILLLVRQENHGVEELLAGENTNLLVLERIQDPGNLGTMLRAGEGAGLTGIIADSGTADLYNPKVIRSTMGSIFRVPVVYTDDLHAVLRTLKRRGVQLCAAHLQGSCDYDEPSYLGANAFLIGNEAAGLREETVALANLRVKIPMLGQVESLNAAVASSILLYELARQRRGGRKL